MALLVPNHSSLSLVGERIPPPLADPALIDMPYANSLTAHLKSLGWSEGLEGEPIRGMHAYGYSRHEQEAIDFYVEQAHTLGMTSLTDLAGNVYLVREGDAQSRESLQSVLVTSHLDTVEGGGAHDGRDGLVAALAAVKALNDSGTTLPHDLVIMVCRSEESDINGVFSLGARLACGDISWNELKSCTNRKSGRSVVEHMQELGIDVGALQKKLEKTTQEERALIPIGEHAASTTAALVELHIEQGRYVGGDPSHPDVGLVECIRGNTRANRCKITPKRPDIMRQESSHTPTTSLSRGRSYTITIPIKGEAAHSGATQQKDRADAVSTALAIGASMLKKFGRTTGAYGPTLQIADLSTSNTSPTTIAGDATITFRVDNATKGEIAKVMSTLKPLCRKLSGDSHNKHLKIGQGGRIGSITPILDSRQGDSQIHAATSSYVEFMSRVQQWFAACYQSDGKDIVFTPSVVNLDTLSEKGPTLGFSFEIRSVDPDVLTNFRSFVDGLAKMFNESPGSLAEIDIPELRISPPVNLASSVVDALSETAREIGVRFNLVYSGAGHDTSTLTRHGYPGAIIFIVQPNPISHNPDEARDDRSFMKATELLLALLRRGASECTGGNFISQLLAKGAQKT